MRKRGKIKVPVKIVSECLSQVGSLETESVSASEIGMKQGVCHSQSDSLLEVL